MDRIDNNLDHFSSGTNLRLMPLMMHAQGAATWTDEAFAFVLAKRKAGGIYAEWDAILV